MHTNNKTKQVRVSEETHKDLDQVKGYMMQEIAINLEKLNGHLTKIITSDDRVMKDLRVYKTVDNLWLEKDFIEKNFNGKESMVFSKFCKIIGYYFGDDNLKRAIQLVPFLKLEPSGVGFRVYFVKEEVS
jgi:hypothetical protein